MSYAVVHMQKIKAPALKGMQIHHQRERKSRSNPDIEEERSDENYDLQNDEKINYNERVHEIIDSQKTGTRKTRKDAVLVNELLITSDEHFFKNMADDERDTFFKESHDFFSERYGKQNVAYAVIHLDEKTPHMHLGIVPMRDGRLQGKNVFNRQELQWIQEEYPKHMQELGFDLERGEKGSERKHVKMQEFKKQELKKVEKELEEKNSYKEKIEHEIKNKKTQFNSEVKKINQIKTGISNVYDTEKKLDGLENKMRRTMRGKRIVTPKDLAELKEFVRGVEKSAVKSVSENYKLRSINEKMAGTLKSVTKERDQVVNRRDELISENRELEQRNSDLKDALRVADSKLRDFGYDRSKMSSIEFKGHLVMDRLESGIKPKNKNVAKNWLDILNENKDKNLISGERIRQSIEQLKVVLQKLLTAFKGLSL